MEWLPGWYYRKQVTISASNVDDDLTNFPLCVPLAHSDVDNNQGVASGIDVRFTASDGETLLPYEWTGFTEDGYSGAFVKIPLISSTAGATIFVYYGNASATDATDKAAVWSDYVVAAHLDNWVDGQEESASGFVLDDNGYLSGVTGIIGGGVQSDTSHPITIGSTQNVQNGLDGNDGLTISFCLKDWDNATSNNRVIYQQGQYSSDTYTTINLQQDADLSWGYNPKLADSAVARMEGSDATGLTNGDDAHILLAIQYGYSAGLARAEAYVDGSSIGYRTKSTSYSMIDSGTASAPDRVGWGSSYGINAIVDELRVRKGGVSAAWAKFEHANLKISGNQILLAIEESLPVVTGPYHVASVNAFQTDAQQAETYIPGIIAGHTHGT